MENYPPEAYSPTGQVWWHLNIWPGKKKAVFGAEPKLAAWLKYNANVGDIFTMRQLRQVLGHAEKPNDDEHLNRRFRELRRYGWCVLSNRDDGRLLSHQYRLEKVGDPIWLGKTKYANQTVSMKLRRKVFDSDGHRCVVCGIGAGEPYPGEPLSKARLTIGHFVAESLRGVNNLENFRTECSRCNEPVKEEAGRSESAAEIWPKIRNLSRAQKTRLLNWMLAGSRQRDLVDRLYDEYRSLPAAQRDELLAQLRRAITE